MTHVYATIVAYCYPKPPLQIFLTCQRMFVEDIQNLYRNQRVVDGEESAISCVSFKIENCLSTISCTTIEDLGLPSTPSDLAPPETEDTPQPPKVHRHMALQSIFLFNDEQRGVFNKLVGAVIPGISTDNLDANHTFVSSSERMFFLDAPGGTEKTFVTSGIKRFLKAKQKNVLTVASSAVAAQLPDSGRTAHSVLQIPIPTDQESTCTVPADSPLADAIGNIDLLI